MENRSELEELLTKYLLGEVNLEEKVFVVNWINASEQNGQYFEKLKKAWRLAALNKTLTHTDVNQEWNYFKQSVTGKDTKTPVANKLEAVADESISSRKVVVYKMLKGMAIAASVLLVIGLGWKWLAQNKAQTPSVVVKGEGKGNSLLASVRHEINTSGKTRQVVLEDGTIVLLADQSELSYSEPFINNRRDVSLRGKADFKVAKDKTKPFTVFSGDISTTALGTKFTVAAFEKTPQITVRLYEGKVVVKSVDSVKRKLKKDFYLVPGQELVYDREKVAATVRSFLTGNKKTQETDGQISFKENPSVPENEKDSWYMFNNQPLNQVFDQLREMYQVDITYSKKDVHNLYFIGKFSKSDSIEMILKQIATLNNLKVTKENSRFVISK